MQLPRFPVFFLKNPACVIGPDDPIKIPYVARDKPEIDYEGELAVVIGARPVKNVTPEEALDYVLGYTASNDVSARRWQGKKGGGQWSRGKSFDTFCPLGPSLLLQQPGVNPDDLHIETKVNGEIVQTARTSDMNFSVSAIISFLSQSTTLLPGTVILTGTPSGVGYTRSPPLFLKKGDVVDVTIEGVGKLTNRVIEEEEREAGPGQVWSHALEKMITP
jgi:2-keto-4-pentenoate hydratase/2-oxohepta-3-ene-1,7-dioic acid hydratase in catechol pathway